MQNPTIPNLWCRVPHWFSSKVRLQLRFHSWLEPLPQHGTGGFSVWHGVFWRHPPNTLSQYWGGTILPTIPISKNQWNCNNFFLGMRCNRDVLVTAPACAAFGLSHPNLEKKTPGQLCCSEVTLPRDLWLHRRSDCAVSHAPLRCLLMSVGGFMFSNIFNLQISDKWFQFSHIFPVRTKYQMCFLPRGIAFCLPTVGCRWRWTPPLLQQVVASASL